jgi:hypothetical protein
MPIFHSGDATRGQANPLSEGVLGQPLGLPQLIKPNTNLHPLPLVLSACVQWHREDEMQKGHERHDKREPYKRQKEYDDVTTENDFEKETQEDQG